MTLGNLKPAKGSNVARRRVGRGIGSGLGKTSGKGHKGHKARTGGSTNPGFEGGQMPMFRRLPKRGFTNPFRETAQVVNLRQLEKVTVAELTPETLAAAGLVRKVRSPIKLLATGEVARAFTVKGIAVSAQAKTKIEAAGGTVEA
ncbi:MAG: 50S ribosomal protein L15 [Gemmatimonadales bacterium]